MRLLTLLSFMLISLCIMAQSADSIFQQANRSYQQGNYGEAITGYHAILDQTIESSDLYYNLANAYYKTQNLPSAILYYEKCLKLNPKHDDASFNLQLANLRIADRIEAQPDLFLNSFVSNLLNQFSSSGWGWIFLGFLFLSLLSWLVYFFVRSITLRKVGFIIGLVSIVFSFALFGIGQSALSQETTSRQAILFATNEYVKSSPDATSTDLFILHEGIKMSIKDELGEWINIQLADGKEGWIPKTSVEII